MNCLFIVSFFFQFSFVRILCLHSRVSSLPGLYTWGGRIPFRGRFFDGQHELHFLAMENRRPRYGVHSLFFRQWMHFALPELRFFFLHWEVRYPLRSLLFPRMESTF